MRCVWYSRPGWFPLRDRKGHRLLPGAIYVKCVAQLDYKAEVLPPHLLNQTSLPGVILISRFLDYITVLSTDGHHGSSISRGARKTGLDFSGLFLFLSLPSHHLLSDRHRSSA